MSDVFFVYLNNTVTVTILFLLLLLLNFVTKKKYSAKYKHLTLLLLGIRLLLPINLNFITLPIIPQSVHTTTSSTNLYQTVPVSEDGTLTESSTALRDKNELTLSHDDAKTDMIVSQSPNSSLTTVKNDTIADKNTKVKNRSTDFVSRLSTTSTQKLHTILHISIIIWLSGIGLFTLYHVVSYRSFIARVRRFGKPITDTSTVSLLSQLTSELGITRQIQIKSYDKISSPLLIGYRNPCIVLPTYHFDESQMTYILKHELVHYKHHDLYQKLIYVIANAIHWFNPVIYLIVRDASCTMELYCDETLTTKQSYEYRQQYSLTLLHILRQEPQKHDIFLTTSFSNQADHIKERFKNIMSPNIKKMRTLLLVICACLILVISNITMNAKTEPTIKQDIPSITPIATPEEAESQITDIVQSKEMKKITNILLLGVDFHPSDNSVTTDSIILVSFNNETKKITANTFLRDLYVDISDHEGEKLSMVYNYGQDIMKEVMLSNFDVVVDDIVCIDYHRAEDIFDLLGGVDVTLTKQEADYLNRTNFISKAKNRHVREGKQHMNGNQLVGYLRVRYVPWSTGEANDLGRTKRVTYVMKSLFDQVSKLDISELLELAKTCFTSISTTMDADEITKYISTYLNSISSINYTCIPKFEDCTASIKNNRSVLEPNLNKAKLELAELIK